MSELPAELREHEWTDTWKDVSPDSETPLYIVRFDVRHLPNHVLNSDAYHVRELWSDTIPSRLWFLLSEQTRRRAGLGRTGLSILVEVNDD